MEPDPVDEVDPEEEPAPVVYFTEELEPSGDEVTEPEDIDPEVQ